MSEKFEFQTEPLPEVFPDTSPKVNVTTPLVEKIEDSVTGFFVSGNLPTLVDDTKEGNSLSGIGTSFNEPKKVSGEPVTMPIIKMSSNQSMAFAPSQLDEK
jgi:hypothetical protein